MKAFLLLPLILLAGCATTDDNDYPSLAPREAEKMDIDLPAADPSVPSPPADAALMSRLNAIEARARAGNATFEPLYGAAANATSAARGAAPGSESWVVANMAISRAQAATSETAAAAADIDKLVDDLANCASKEPGVAGVTEAIATQRHVHAINNSQIVRIRALSSQVGSR